MILFEKNNLINYLGSIFSISFLPDEKLEKINVGINF